MLCRLCLHEHNIENCSPIFNETEENNLTKLIAKHLQLEITQDDSYSTVICKECLEHLNDFHEFFRLIEQRQNLLKNEFLELKENNSIDGDNVQASNIIETFQTLDNLNDEPFLDIKNELKVEIEKTVGNFHPEEEFCYANISIDCEAQDTDEDDVPLQKLFKNQNTESKKVRLRRSKLKETIKHSNKLGKISKLSSDKLKTNLRSTLLKTNVEITKKFLKKTEKSRQTKWTAEIDKESDELIAKHILLKCDICDISTQTYKDLRIHFRESHNIKGYMKCCGMKFQQKFLLLDHIKTHLNPEHFKCKNCNKILKTRVSLEHHISVKHVAREEMKHACTLCGKRFPYLSNLNLHMFVHKDEKDHKCEFCNKGFKTTSILKAHIQHMHGERTSYVCDTCGKEYRFKMSFERHVAEHQGNFTEPNLQCQICEKWFSQSYLRRHIKRHKLENVDCNTCGRTFKSKPALASHLERAHKNTQTYPCTLCGRIFERPHYLKEHVDMHLGKKDYCCSYCPREFRSRANMYSHVKKSHFEQWKRARLERENGATRSFRKNNELKIEPQI